MVLAIKKAVGSEYGYHYDPSYLPKQREAQRIKRKKRASSIKIASTVILSVSVFFVVGICFTGLKAYTARLNRNVQVSKQTIENIQTQNEKMRLEIARLKALDRIEQLASSQMGMIKNPVTEYVILPEDTVAVLQLENKKIDDLPSNENNEKIISKIAKSLQIFWEAKMEKTAKLE